MIDTDVLPCWVEGVDDRPTWDRGDAWTEGQRGSIYWAHLIPVPKKRNKHRYGR